MSAAPKLRIRLRSQGLGADSFSPLSPAEAFDLDLDQVDPDLVRELEVDVDLGLEPGHYPLPLTTSLVVAVDVPAGSRATGRVTGGRRVGGEHPETTVDTADLVFDPPLVIHDIVKVLARLSDLVEDDQAAEILERVRLLAVPRPTGRRARLLARASRVLPLERAKELLPLDRMRQLLPLVPGAREGLEAGVAQLANVTLRRVTAQSVLRNGEWQLDLRFSGRFNVLGSAPVPFRSVRLPHVILPAPYASLRRLTSGKPLAAATLHTERVPVVELIAMAGSAVREVRSRVTLGTDLPATEVLVALPGGGRVGVDVEASEGMTVQGDVAVDVQRARVRITADDLSLRLGDSSLTASGAVELRAVHAEDSVVDVVAIAAGDGGWPEDRLTVHLEAGIEEGTVDQMELEGRYDHPMLRGQARMRVRLDDLALRGGLQAEIAPETGSGRATHLELTFSGAYAVAPGAIGHDGTTDLHAEELRGRLEGRAYSDGPSGYGLDVTGDASMALLASTTVSSFPELDVQAGELRSHVEGRVAFRARLGVQQLDDGLFGLDFHGTHAEMVLDQTRLELHERSFVLPAGSSFELRVPEAMLSTSGLGHSRYGLRWDLQGQSPVLSGRGRSVEIFVPDLRQGELEVALSPAGGLSITGEEGGLYDARTFNALLSPDQEIDRWMALARNDEALDHVVAAAAVLSDDLADALTSFRDVARRAEAAAEAEGIDRPADGIPAPVVARMLSRMLTETPELEDRILPIVQRVVDGDGLDVPATRLLIEETHPDHRYAFEVDRGLRWFARVLGPTEPLAARRVQELGSLAELPVYRELFEALPSAGEIYRAVASDDPLPAGLSQRVARVASGLSLEQLRWLIARDREDWRPADLAHLRRVAALKERVSLITESYGGPGHAPQAAAVGFFIGATVHHAPAAGEVIPRIVGEPTELLAHPDCLLGPAETASLLQVGLASAMKGGTVQHNQRLLLELILVQPPAWLRQVLYELCDGIPRVLANVLMSLLNLEQDALFEPIDLVAAFSERLGVELPRQEDFMAGGRWARQPYYAALNSRAEWILAECESYVALREWLQTERQPVPAPLPEEEGAVELAEAARAAIAHADALGAACTFQGSEPARRRRAREAYEQAFAACRALVAEQPRAFRWPWFKAFWGRTYEALMVLSVVRNVQQDVDRVRYWLQTRSGAPIPRSEQALVQSVIRALYLEPADREVLLADPLVRLLIDPPEGRYDFTVISCMGVITEGSEGQELEDAFRRLEQTRGVRVLRADTATARSLEYNAARVEDAVRQATTPWGYVGYSQGCANGLRAETLLLGGTPDQQALAEGLVSRHMLCAAFNGSGHSTGGDQKFLAAMVDAENFLAHYQAVFSKPAIDAALKAVRMVLDAPIVVDAMGGADSLSYDGVVHALRELQIKDDVPTTLVRGVVIEAIRPEALDMLSNLLTRQMESDQHDTQVLLAEAVGHPLHVRNPQSDAMRSCDMGALPQITHHWSPLLQATELITTQRDLDRAIYDFPKDRHVFPWIEVNARFGVIRPA